MGKVLKNTRPIAILDDDPKVLASMSRMLEAEGFGGLCCFERAADFIEAIGKGASAVILDLALPDARGIDILLELRASHPEVPVIVVTGSSGVNEAVECMKLGAFDFITKGCEPERLVASLRRALRAEGQRLYLERLRDRFLGRRLENPEAFSDIITQDEAMLSLFLYLEAVSGMGESVLLVGETGTGKELLAEALHRASGRRGELVKINVAGLDDSLFSDSLFGHRKGAFTGADEARAGLLRKAAGGSVLLDEIGDLGPASQIKLLRLIETGEFYPSGSDSVEFCEVRFILSTHADLEALAEAGRFRRDLLYRIGVHRALVPPLRERRGDLPLLVSAFLDEARGRRSGSSYRPSAEDMARLGAYAFPGNVRELRSIVFDAVARGRLESPNLPGAAPEAPASAPGVSFGAELPTLAGLGELLIDEALVRAKGNVSSAAHSLGISRQALSKRLGRRMEGT